MHGPGAYLKEHFDDLVARLEALDLAPEVHWSSAEKLDVEDESVHLVVTSPPYPMIEMWDAQLEAQLGLAVTEPGFYEAAHDLLARAWAECHRVLVPGGILAVNVGDATRKLNGNFRLFPNHVTITERCERLGFQSLVPVLWKKPTNKPNAFLGSGFLPPNGYVTLDCEYVLLFRKGPRRKLPPKDPLRYASEMSKAERDRWFTQVWDDVRGARQHGREAGVAPFPPEIPRRLIRMFSCLGETVLDPFAGTGCTLEVAHALGRKAVGAEVNRDLEPLLQERVPTTPPEPRRVLEDLMRHYG